MISQSLNCTIIYFDKFLKIFLQCINNNKYRLKYESCSSARLVGKFRRFQIYCWRQSQKHQQRQHYHNHNRLQTVEHSSIETALVSGGTTQSLLINDTIANESFSLALETPTTSAIEPYERSTNATNAAAAAAEPRNSVKIVVKFVKKKSVIDSAAGGVESLKNFAINEKVKRNTEVSVNENALMAAAPSDSTQTKCNYDEREKTELPPQIPLRNPKTTLSTTAATKEILTTAAAVNNLTSPPLPAKRESLHAPKTIMTVPTLNAHPTQQASAKNSKSSKNQAQQSYDSEDNIYQPIWNFKTGEVPEQQIADADYCEFDRSRRVFDDASSAYAMASFNVDDHGEWETDDEFMFTTNYNDCDAAARTSTTLVDKSTHSNGSDCSSITGSTVTGFGSSTATIASFSSASLAHHMLRNIGIFYSLTDPKIRAIIYNYDRAHASTYFNKPPPPPPIAQRNEESNDSAAAAGNVAANFPIQQQHSQSQQQQRSPMPPPRTTSSTSKTKACLPARPAKVGPKQKKSLPDSVQAWKFMLLDTQYLEDEEDMIVSETEILRAQEIKEDVDTPQTQQQQLNILQRFKSASIGNLVDLPQDDDKKSIAERMRNKFQRGVFKMNVLSPKSEKKRRNIFKRSSLYIEDGMKPKYPIFGAPLEHLELNYTTQPNVPRFVVDCIGYIEREECIHQDGLYRASGNKVSIDELKQKLSESYIYDPKLLMSDDIHTLTSLLKQFFRELTAPLIPESAYERLSPNLADPASIEAMSQIFGEMREPNRSTLKFLIKHLTNVSACSADNRMPASNLAIVWGPCILSANRIEFDIGRMNTLAKVLIENFDRIFSDIDNERLVS